MAEIVGFIGAGLVESDGAVGCRAVLDETAKEDDEDRLEDDEERDVTSARPKSHPVFLPILRGRARRK